MVAWAAIGAIAGVVSAAVSVIKFIRESGQSDDAVLEAIRQLSRQIEAAKQEILAAISAAEFRELKGTVDGLILTFQTYDGERGDEERLRSLIDEGAIVLGRLAEALRTLDPSTDGFQRGVDVYITMLFLRAIAMHERERRWHRDEVRDIPLMFPAAVDLLGLGIDGIRTAIARRFRGVDTQRMGDSIEVGYWFDGQFIVVDWVIDEPIERGIHEPVGPALARARADMERRRSRLFDESARRQFFQWLIDEFTSGTEPNRLALDRKVLFAKFGQWKAGALPDR